MKRTRPTPVARLIDRRRCIRVASTFWLRFGVRVKVREIGFLVRSTGVVTIEHNYFMFKNANAPTRIIKERSASPGRFEHHAVCAAKPETLGNLLLERK